MKLKRGYTLVELIISMGLFAIFSTLVIFSFITFANIQAKTIAVKNSQQKLRTALDQMVRRIKEAKSVDFNREPFNKDGNTYEKNIMTLYYSDPGTPTLAVQYLILSDDDSLFYKECNMTGVKLTTYKPCTSVDGVHDELREDILSINGRGGDSVGSVRLDYTDSGFTWNSPRPTPDDLANLTSAEIAALKADDKNNLAPSIKIVLDGEIRSGGNEYYADHFRLETVVSLERK